MYEFSTWLGQTDFSLALQTTVWAVPAIQIFHIACVCIVVGSILVVSLRVWGAALTTIGLEDVIGRFAPWVWTALLGLLLSGLLLIIAEPIRELYSLSFWIKMGLIVVGGIIAILFQSHVRRNAAKWDAAGYSRGLTRTAAALTLGIWIVIIVMGRWIAFDTVIFGDLSPHRNMPDTQTAELSAS